MCMCKHGTVLYNCVHTFTPEGGGPSGAVQCCVHLLYSGSAVLYCTAQHLCKTVCTYSGGAMPKFYCRARATSAVLLYCIVPVHALNVCGTAL
jgi:hypothetical protein